MRYPQPSKDTVSKLRIHRQRDLSWVALKPQWSDSKNNWHDFREGRRLIRKLVPLAKFHGLELLHLSESRIARETIKCNKWLKNWKLNNNSKAKVVEYTTKSDTTSKNGKKKEKESSTCEMCGKKYKFIFGEVNCSTCSLELDRLKYLLEQEEENSPEFQEPEY